MLGSKEEENFVLESERVITEIRIDDRGDGTAFLHRNVKRVEDVLGRSLPKSA